MADNGFEEEEPPQIVEVPSKVQSWRLKIGKDGRLVIPAAARAQMELGEDGIVVAKLSEGELRISAPIIGLRRVRAIAMKYKKPGESVVDDFIAERRAEQRREDEK